MDLNLKGSQINLVARPKQSPKSFPRTCQLHQNRPRSATFFSKRTASSPFFYRPQSADPRLRGRVDSACGYPGVGGEYQSGPSKKDKRYESVSSSDLLQLLLDEPIKRPWLCRGTPAEGASSPDEAGDLVSSSRTFFSNSSLNTGTSSNGKHNAKLGIGKEKETRYPVTSSGVRPSVARMSSANSSTLNPSGDNKSLGNSGNSSSASDYWHSLTYASMCKVKADLPGRVSFCNGTEANDDDSSDNDNDKQERDQCHGKEDSSISAPGPVKVPDMESAAEKNTEPITTSSTEIVPAGLKKSVHFGATGGTDVLAETYEYPKCPSENCSCGTPSSSVTSMNDTLDTNYDCGLSLYKCSLGSEKQLKTIPTAIKSGDRSSPIEVLPTFQEHNISSNPVVNNKLDDQPTSKLSSSLNNMESPNYTGKFPSSKTQLEKQNNFSDIINTKPKNQTLNKSSSKQNMVKDLLKPEKNLGEINLGKETHTPSNFELSEEFINNYLKEISAKTKTISKKRENKVGTEESTLKSTKPKFAPVKYATGKNKREDSNLSEFNLDKVDSWMSTHDQTHMTCGDHSKSRRDPEEQSKRLSGRWSDDEGGPHDDTASEISTKSSESSTQEDTTYDEIVSVIKEIEEDKRKDNYAEKSAKELELDLDEVKKNTQPQATPAEKDSTEPQKSPDKYKDILNYLDNVEDSCDKTLLETRRSIPESNRSEIEFVVEPDIAEDVPKLSDLLMLPNHQLARRVIALSLRANELANAMYLSKEHLTKMRSEKQKSVRSEKASSAARLQEQKKHYEAVVARHQGFIEQLLKDKGSLCEKVAALTRRLESQNQAWEHKLETEVQRVKETTMAGEKIRRERWVRENTKKIKELTVKGLEAEINKMNSNHQREITELKRSHQQQLLDALEEARQKHDQIETAIRDSCAQDREAIIERERTAIRERFERQLEEEKKSCDEQKQRLLEEFSAERERLHAELREKEIEHQTKRQELQREKEQELEEAVAELQEKISKQDEKYRNRINTISKQYEADFEIWKRDYENSAKVQQVEKENTIRQHYRAERDQQIDAIVNRMDAEAQKNAEENEAKINRIKEKYEKDLQAAEAVEKSLREKYTDARNRLAESDAQVRNLQAEIKQLQMELGHSKKMCSDFLVERQQVRENIRNEIQSEVATLKSEHDKEIQKIHQRVQQAIEKKDATVEILQKENGLLRERCIKLEAVIRQQRKDYCVK